MWIPLKRRPSKFCRSDPPNNIQELLSFRNTNNTNSEMTDTVLDVQGEWSSIQHPDFFNSEFTSQLMPDCEWTESLHSKSLTKSWATRSTDQWTFANDKPENPFVLESTTNESEQSENFSPPNPSNEAPIDNQSTENCQDESTSSDQVQTVVIRLQNFRSCIECNAKFKRVDQLKAHMRELHPGLQRVHQCDICGIFFDRKTSAERHRVEKHVNHRNHACEICSKQFKRKDDLKRHVSTTHLKLSDWPCHLCGTVFHRKDHLKEHFKTQHLSSCELKCDYCDRICATKNGKTNHMNNCKKRPV